MKKALLVTVVPLILAISCSKKNGGTAPIEPPLIRYMSLTVNSNWSYETIDNIANTTSSYTLTSSNRDSSINGKTYHVYLNSSNGASEYYNISNSDYYTYRELPATAVNNKFELLYLKDDQNAGASWSQPFNIVISNVPITGTVNNKLIETGISRTVNNITYSNVLHVQTTLTVSGLPASSLTSNIDSYYAPKAGLIENTTIVNSATLSINVNTKTTLKSSTVF